MKIWLVQWDHGEPTIKYNLLRPREARYGLAGMLLHWGKFEVQVEILGRPWTVKRSREDE